MSTMSTYTPTREYIKYSHRWCKLTGDANAGTHPPLNLGYIHETNFREAQARLRQAGFLPVFLRQGCFRAFLNVRIIVWPYALTEAYAAAFPLVKDL
jgi:hypothetical protein